VLKLHIKNIIHKHLGMDPTHDQSLLMDLLAGFIISEADRQVLVVRGYAGTGKTTVMGAFVNTLRELKLKSVLLAPTGRAAKVFAMYAGVQSFTIHKKIYRQKTFKDGQGRFVLENNLHARTFFIVDEASLLSNQSSFDSSFGSGRLLDDLIEYVYNDKGCSLILVGDTAQLPPVGMETSPALDSAVLASHGLEVFSCELKEVVRQAETSGILSNATRVRELIEEERMEFPQIVTRRFPDVVSISGSEFVEVLSDAYSRYGNEETMVVCRSNKQANRYNQGIRSRVLCMEEEFSSGDYIMVVKNNYHWVAENDRLDFLANGDIARIKRIGRYEERYGFRFLHADLVLPDYGDYEVSGILLLDTVVQETPALSSEDNKRLFYSVAEDYAHIRVASKRWAAVREDPYFNALQIKFAYAVTCHKSQGGQWKAVFVDHGWFKEDMLTSDYLRWIYTAFTRAVEKLYLVNFDERFIENT
jgi:exodeoxyribonuclease-5